MKKLCVLMTVLLLLSTVCATIPASAETDDGYYHGKSTSYRYFPKSKEDKEYDQYRLPGIIVTQKGTVIVYGEARYLDRNNDNLGNKNGDLCEMDLFLRRSTDGGKTFGDRIWIAKGADYFKKGYGETINNPVMFVGNDGRLHLMFSCNVGQGGMWYCYSDDDGVTWTDPVNKISQLGAPSWSMIACGPGHGICLEDGTLMVTVWVSGGSAGQYSVYSLYSKDNGNSWKLGLKASDNKDESCIVELSDGSVMINSRQFTGHYKSDYASRPLNENDVGRRVTVSKNGIDGWSTTRKDAQLIDPGCQGSMIKVDLEGLPHAILFVNNASATSRNHLTVRCSFDDGATWTKELLIDEMRGGYSDIAVDANGKVYVIYEINAGASVQLVSFSFYDVFCEGDETLHTYQNVFDTPYTLLKSQKGVEVEKLDGNALKASITEAFEASFTLNVTDVTKLLTADDTPILAIKIKSNVSANVKESKIGVYFRCGSNANNSIGDLYTTAMFPNDGEYHIVVFDISSRDMLSGNLYAVEFFLTPVGQEVAVGDSIEVSTIGFFSNIEEANKIQLETEITTNDTGLSESSGCKSALGGLSHFWFIPLGIVFVIKRKRKK